MILPAYWELKPMTKGLTYDGRFIVKVNGSAKTLTGCTVEMPLYFNGELYTTLTSGSGLVIGETTGIVDFLVSATATANYSEGIITYWLTIREADAVTKYAWLKGHFPVNKL